MPLWTRAFAVSSPTLTAPDFSQVPENHLPRDPALRLSCGVLIVITLACLLAPVLPIAPPSGGNVMEADLAAFHPGHLLGTDQNGNDLLARLLYGGRTSLLIALAVNLTGMVLGGSIGALSAFLGGVVDSALMRALDALVALPSLVLALAMSEALGPGKASTAIALCLFAIPAFARIARAATLRLRERPFVLVAKVFGAGPARILVTHLAPNILPQLIAFGLLAMGISIVVEGGLSFLGLGVQPPEPSWGNMIALGQQQLAVRPYLLFLPGASLFLTVLALNLLGERLRERWNRP